MREQSSETLPGALVLRQLSLVRGLSFEEAQQLLHRAPIDEEGMQGFFMRSAHKEVVLILRRRTRDGQVAYQTLGVKRIQKVG